MPKTVGHAHVRRSLNTSQNSTRTCTSRTSPGSLFLFLFYISKNRQILVLHDCHLSVCERGHHSSYPSHHVHARRGSHESPKCALKIASESRVRVEYTSLCSLTSLLLVKAFTAAVSGWHSPSQVCIHGVEATSEVSRQDLRCCHSPFFSYMSLTLGL